MRSHVLLSALLLLTLGCTAVPAPVPTPEAAPAADPAAAPAAEPEMAPAPRMAAADAAAAEAAMDGVRNQCQNGGARACLRLCMAEKEVDCTGLTDDECKQKKTDKAKSVKACGDGVKLGELCTLNASKISPTQAAVGMFAVDCKSKSIYEKRIKDRGKNRLRRYLLDRPVPMVVGPGPGFYITDRHHLSTAVLQTNVVDERKRLFMCPMAERKNDDSNTFWQYMQANNFAWLYSREGDPIGAGDLPARLSDIEDDPFRTLSRWVRDSCGYIKCGKVCGGKGEDTMDLARCEESPVSAYYLEFHWANFLRKKMDISGVYDLPLKDQGARLQDHLQEAMDISRGMKAIEQGLPGWNNGLIEPKLVRFDGHGGCEK